MIIGEVPEWSNGADSKSVVPFEVPRVRIPPSPPNKSIKLRSGFFDLSGVHGELLIQATIGV